MNLEQELFRRSQSQCEFCKSSQNLQIYEVTGAPTDQENHILICTVCTEQINDPEKVEVNHWRCLNDSMWSTVPPVQVTAWRMLNRLRSEGWPQDLLDMMYLDEGLKNWAVDGQDSSENIGEGLHKDSNGVPIESGDAVVLVKDLNVKGSSMVAKRGTTVRKVSLVHDNPEQIEGRVDGQMIVILTKFVKKV